MIPCHTTHVPCLRHTGYPDPKDLDNLQYVIDSLLKTTTHNTKLSVIFSIKIINVVDT